MLIKVLNDYYDILQKQGKIISEGYSNEKVHFLIELSETGELARITDCKVKSEIALKNGKVKKVENPRSFIFPKRTQKPGIDSNIVEHRPLYIFGLNVDKEQFVCEDKTNKAKKSHDDFVKKNLEFIEGLNSPMIDAYRLFIENWVPENEVENPHLKSIFKEYSKVKFAFCLEGQPNVLLHKDEKIIKKWDENFAQMKSSEVVAQCAVTGEILPIARIHDKIKGVAGANATGAGLIVFNNPSDNSYVKEQSYNSNISEKVMKHYTQSLNYLLESKKNHTIVDGLTVVHFAMSENDLNHKIVSKIIFDNDFDDEDSDEDNDCMNDKETEKFLNEICEDAKDGNLISSRLSGIDCIDENVKFYMIGFKPNSARISVKFVYEQKIGKIFENLVLHQQDLKFGEKYISVPFWKLKQELVSPKSKKDKINPELSSRIWKSILYGTNYPENLMQIVINRVKLDSDTDTNKFIKINNVRTGILKACINRKLRNAGKEEEITMSLNQDSTNQAYLCGRLFAVYEKIQRDAAIGELNRTIKDSYFSAACSNPAAMFYKIEKLSIHHLKKLDVGRKVYFDKLINEILEKMDEQFPQMLPPTEQGKFIIGYHQQNKDLYTSKQNKEDK